jgi:hypothetical protein
MNKAQPCIRSACSTRLHLLVLFQELSGDGQEFLPQIFVGCCFGEPQSPFRVSTQLVAGHVLRAFPKFSARGHMPAIAPAFLRNRYSTRFNLN